MIGLLMLAEAARVASFQTAGDLHQWCRAGSRPMCMAYVMGISDEMNVMQEAGLLPKRYCSPFEVTGEQVADTATKYLESHPESHPIAAGTVVTNALLDAFPCPK
jgi:hypothetical protein